MTKQPTEKQINYARRIIGEWIEENERMLKSQSQSKRGVTRRERARKVISLIESIDLGHHAKIVINCGQILLPRNIAEIALSDSEPTLEEWKNAEGGSFTAAKNLWNLFHNQEK